MGVLMKEEKGYAIALDQLRCERGNVMDCIKGFRHQRDELNQEIQAKTAGIATQSSKGTF